MQRQTCKKLRHPGRQLAWISSSSADGYSLVQLSENLQGSCCISSIVKLSYVLQCSCWISSSEAVLCPPVHLSYVLQCSYLMSSSAAVLCPPVQLSYVLRCSCGALTRRKYTALTLRSFLLLRNRDHTQ